MTSFEKNTPADKRVATRASGSKSVARQAFSFEDNRPETINQQYLQEKVNSCPQVRQQSVFQDKVNNNQQHQFPSPSGPVAQLKTASWTSDIDTLNAVLSNSILLGFPYADVREMGSSTVVVTDDDAGLAQQLADELGEYLWYHRQDFAGQLIDVDAALNQIRESDGPICLLDMGDNVGGGSPADSTHLVHAIARQEIRPAFACLFDPASVERASAAGSRASLAPG